MLTTTTITALVSLSGGEASRYNWQGVGGTSRFDCNRRLGSKRHGARIFLFRYQQGMCPDCGLALDSTAEFCHVVSRGLDARTSDEGRGWTAGNLFLGHRACNKLQQARGPVVMPAHLTRPDLVPAAIDWPDTPTLRAWAREDAA